MSEVIRYIASYFPYEGLDLNGQCARHDGEEFVHASDFDRITAERDAMQQRLTAADERADELEGLLLLWMSPVQRTMAGRCRLVERTDAALNPAECNDSCEFCKGWGFRSNPDGADEGCGACNGTGKEPSDDQQ